jgi:hypothetical protein
LALRDGGLRPRRPVKGQNRQLARIVRRGPLERVVEPADLVFSHFFNDAWLSPDGRPAKRPSTLMSSSRSSQ